MSKKTLLLNSGYEVLAFISEKRAIKLLYKNKVDVIYNWEDHIPLVNGSMKLPAIIRLKKDIKRTYTNNNFSRKALIKRDHSICQYCKMKLSASQITIDHVVPRFQGGITSFSNCVVSCADCNGRKANRTPNEAGMVLLNKPTHPSFSTITTAIFSLDQKETWHENWNDFIR